MKKLLDVPAHTWTALKCQRSLFEFLVEFWDIFNTTPYEHNWHIEYLCDEFQLVIDKYVLDRKPHIEADKWYKGILDDISLNIIFNVPPGTGKTSIISRISTPFIWANDQSKSLMGSTIDAKNATEFATTSRDIIESEKYQLFYPHVSIRRDISAKTFFQNNEGGRRYSLTTKGKSKTGKHVDIIIEDDPMDYTTAQSPQEAKQCIEGFKAIQTRKKDKKKNPYVLAMQRLSSIDTTQHALKSLNNVRHICLPAEDVHDNIKPEELRKYYIDGLLDANRLSREILEDQKKGLNDESKPISKIAYNIQFNQVSQTTAGLMYPDLNIVDRLPDNRDGAVRYSFTDVADTGADYFATWFVEVNNGKIYVFDAIYTDEGTGTTKEKIKNKITLHNSVVNKVEVNNQGSVFVTLLQSMGLNISGYHSSGNKEERISAFSQFISYVNFVKPNTMPYHTNEYNAAFKHIESYPKQGKADDDKDDAEDALTEMMRYLYTNLRYLFS